MLVWREGGCGCIITLPPPLLSTLEQLGARFFRTGDIGRIVPGGAGEGPVLLVEGRADHQVCVCVCAHMCACMHVCVCARVSPCLSSVVSPAFNSQSLIEKLQPLTRCRSRWLVCASTCLPWSLPSLRTPGCGRLLWWLWQLWQGEAMPHQHQHQLHLEH